MHNFFRLKYITGYFLFCRCRLAAYFCNVVDSRVNSLYFKVSCAFTSAQRGLCVNAVIELLSLAQYSASHSAEARSVGVNGTLLTLLHDLKKSRNQSAPDCWKLGKHTVQKHEADE